MTTRSYPRLSIEDFGRHLLTSGDLDPVYIALHGMQTAGAITPNALRRWLLAYWCLYHCGAASYIAEAGGEEYWMRLLCAAENRNTAPCDGRWPRGHERRHWRGENALKSLSSLRQKAAQLTCEKYQATDFGAEYLVQWLAAEGSFIVPINELKQPYSRVRDRTLTLTGFGPWMSFKVADMVDRVLGYPVDFNLGAVSMFDDPRKAAEMLWDMRMGPNAKPTSGKTKIEVVTNWLINIFSTYQAPPLNDRPVNIQEVETILCKWKSHMNGHYGLNNDIDEIKAGLEPWVRVSPLATAFMLQMPRRAP